MSYVNIRGARFGGHNSFVARGPISDEQLAVIAPSVFAGDKHESRSDRYTYLPTIEILRGMRDQGFEVVAAIQGKCRTEGKAEFTKHMLRFRHADHAMQGKMGGVAPEAVLVNSHDGTSAYRLMSGVFRSICTNSMIVMEQGATDVRVPHKGNIVDQVIEGTFQVINESARTIERVEAWQGVVLNHDERKLLADAAHVVRFGTEEDEVDNAAIKPDQLLTPRRREDVGNTLWLTHNVLQENMIRGGLRGVTRDANGRRRNTTTRDVKAIDGDVKLNRALWMLSDRMAKLKGVAP